MQLLSSQSFGRILAALLLAPSAINLCLAAPQPLGNTVESSALVARKDTSALKSFKEKVDAAPAKIRQDQTKFVDFSKKEEKSVSSVGYNQCFGVIIGTSKAAVVGHYTCGTVGQQNAERELKAAWDANKNDKLKSPKVYIYAKVKVVGHKIQESTYENAADLDAFKKIVKDLTGKDASIEKYHNVDDVITESKNGVPTELPGFDQKTADKYSKYAGYYVTKGLLGLDVKFMTLDMQKDSYKK
ncbi:hypothetical protein PG993_014191 [Apiospora rasikravindrae]|uniref:Uncharacterized protein n=1 Tax=Apiospora rasikravindrae TaxID=990691 RepID=A0ABR1RSD5_9PEZI